MADHPLLPQARLRDLHALMQRCRALERKQQSRSGLGSKFGSPAREGWLAATALQLEPGDLLYPEADDQVQAALHPHPADDTPSEVPSSLRLPVCAGIARGLQAAGTKRLVLAYASARIVEPSWTEALTWAQRDRLPLLLACTDLTKPGRKRQGDVISWEGMARLAETIALPVFPVDAEDPVAVYRVMYEAVLRTRDIGGPAVLWGVFSKRSEGAGSRSAQPLARLEKYLTSRGIKLRS